MQRLTIIGLGLIGGSIGLGLQRWSREGGEGKQSLDITGFDLDIEQQQYARKIKAIDRAEWNLVKAVQNADFVIMATPVTTMRDLMSDIAPHLQPGTIVTDVGSTKADVVAWAEELLPKTVSFIGGHPMAGKSQSIEGADADLFKGATWCICPSVRADDEAIRNVLGMVTALGAESFFIDPSEHDAYVAGVSHLPFVVSAALMSATSKDSSWRDMKALSASGFRDATRLAAGSPQMHRDIVVTNAPSVRRWVDAMIDELEALRTHMDSPDAADQLLGYFEKARDARADWATQSKSEGGLIQDTENELNAAGLSGQMGRMFFGGMFNRRRAALEDRIGRDSRSATQDRGDRHNGQRP